MVLYSPDWTNTGFSFILLTVNLFRHSTLTEQGLYVKLFKASLLCSVYLVQLKQFITRSVLHVNVCIILKMKMVQKCYEPAQEITNLIICADPEEEVRCLALRKSQRYRGP